MVEATCIDMTYDGKKDGKHTVLYKLKYAKESLPDGWGLMFLTPSELRESIKNNELYVDNLIIKNNKIVSTIKLKATCTNYVRQQPFFYSNLIEDTSRPITDYELLLENGNKIEISPDGLKEAIKNGNLIVDNITLTSNNRLIIKKKTKPTTHKGVKVAYITHPDIQKIDCAKNLKFQVNVNVNSILNKAELLGSKVTQLKKDVYAVELAKDMLIITPADKVGIKNGKNFFMNTKFTSIDMTNTYTALMRDASGMFAKTMASQLDLKDMDTHNVMKMDGMFSYVKVQELDLSNFDTCNVQSMRCMFEHTALNNLNISSFNTSNVVDLSGMFAYCRTSTLDISNFNYDSLIQVEHMLSNMTIQTLNLGTIRMSEKDGRKHQNAFLKKLICDINYPCKIERLILIDNSPELDNSYYKPYLHTNRTYIGNLDEVRNSFKIKTN